MCSWRNNKLWSTSKAINVFFGPWVKKKPLIVAGITGRKKSSGLMFLKCRDCSVPLGSHTSRYLDRTGEKRKYRERKNYRKGVSLLWRLQCIRNNKNTFQSKLDPYVKRAHFNATWVSSQIFRKTPSYFGHIRGAKPICSITWRNHTVRFLDKSSVGQDKIVSPNCLLTY